MYDVLLVDPPWRFTTRSPKGNGRGPESHYPTLTADQLAALPVGTLAGDNAALFLWCCWPSIFRDVPQLLQAWGFTYRSCAFMWIKQTRTGGGLHTGLGYYTRANSEPCLLAVRGRMPVESHAVHQVIYSPVRSHSQKPEEQYTRIERLYPGRRYVELFARARRPGWAAWGNEIDSDPVISAALINNTDQWPFEKQVVSNSTESS